MAGRAAITFGQARNNLPPRQRAMRSRASGAFWRTDAAAQHAGDGASWRLVASAMVEMWSALAAHLIHDGQKIGQRPFALRGVWRSRPKLFQSTVDGLVHFVPVRRGPRLQARLCLIPRRLEVLC